VTPACPDPADLRSRHRGLSKARALPSLADERSSEIGMFVRPAAALGTRVGEVCGRGWTDLDDGAGTTTVQRAVIDVAGRLHVKAPKPTPTGPSP
jgi:hypothetical protein